YWGSNFGKSHTVPCKVTGRCGMIFARLVPIPRVSGIDPSCQENMLVSQIVTATYGDTVCTLKDTSYIIGNNYEFLTPELWEKSEFSKGPYQELSGFLTRKQK
ncbi:S2e ribosomal protein, partial [Mucor mucedo]|uniref:S2e ribosomal protein n=1 Tax=Mucor mucedo TaxID=29922 RepID=UPI00221E6196